jgi:glutaryl-CoA dehydrogenase
VSVHGHLAQAAIRFFGTPEQKARFLPRMARGEILGAFSLTEPDHGSDPSGLEVTARPVAGGYRLDGHKKWATNATHAGVTVVWARVVEEGQVPTDASSRAIRGFIVEAGTPGFRPIPIHRKLSFRVSASSEIRLENCFIPEANALPSAIGLGAALKCLNEARYGIVWGVAGAAQACFEEAVTYAGLRVQFGRPIAGFQLTQSKLATMYGQVTQAMLLALHLGRLKERGALHHTDVSLGKLVNVRHALDVARTARTVLGANGILDTAVSLRHAANLESELTYEGTDEVHQLVLGRKLTGLDAFRAD